MRRTLFIIAALLCSFALRGEDRLVERVYLSTDKTAYVAGERIWISAFCFDQTHGGLSKFSAVAYVELESTDGNGAATKIALNEGRGAGALRIPANLPTGNYRLCAYTALNRGEIGYDFSRGARTVAIYNTLTTAKVRDGVEIIPDDCYCSPEGGHSPSGNLKITLPSTCGTSSDVAMTLRNLTLKPATMCVTVVHEDGLAHAEEASIVAFDRHPAVKGFRSDVAPEYDGEIICACLCGADREKVASDAECFALLSTPGDPTNIYTASLQDTVRFRTGNIYGSQDLVFELVGAGPDARCWLDIVSPFVAPAPEKLPKLGIARWTEPLLVRRGRGMVQSTRQDTLFQYVPKKNDFLLRPGEMVRYSLDDYTRFPTMEELFVEIIPELRARKKDGRWGISVKMNDVFRSAENVWGNSLMMIDGVPVLDHSKIMEYDPSLIREVEIYPYTYLVGSNAFGGVANFVTFKGNMPFISFPDNVRIVDFAGTSYPMAFNDCPDEANTICWHPLVEIGASQEAEMHFRTPAYPGSFHVTVEGVLEDGEPFHTEESFVVK